MNLEGSNATEEDATLSFLTLFFGAIWERLSMNTQKNKLILQSARTHLKKEISVLRYSFNSWLEELDRLEAISALETYYGNFSNTWCAN